MSCLPMDSDKWRSVLSPEVNQATSHWKVPCRALFQNLVENSPRELLKITDYELLKPYDLTFAAEYLGNVDFDKFAEDKQLHDDIRSVLYNLAVNHQSSVVQEGAIYGLCRMHVNIHELLKVLYQETKSPSIKSITHKLIWSGW